MLLLANLECVEQDGQKLCRFLEDGSKDFHDVERARHLSTLTTDNKVEHVKVKTMNDC